MGSGTMSTEEREELRRAAAMVRPIARAAAVGRRNGTSLLVFGVLGGILGLPGLDPTSLAVAALLIATGSIELRTSRRLACADPAAPWILARNELVLMAGIVVFCVLELTVLREDPEELASRLGGTAALGIDVSALASSMNTLIYSTSIAVTLLYQGGMARYFLRRRVRIEAYLRECPEWARQVVGEPRD